MLLIYNFGLFLYSALLRIFSLFHGKARLWVEGRKDWNARLKQVWVNDGRPVAWFHAASLGEFEQARPVIEAFKKEHPKYKIALTFFSPSGFEIRKNYSQADWVGYMPMDSASNAKAFLDILQPTKAFFVKYEFWHHYTSELKKRNIPTYMFSAIFRPSQSFFKPWGSFFRNILLRFDHIFLQDEDSALLLKDIGIENCTVCGDTRYDRVIEIATQAKEIPLAASFQQSKPCIVVGSSWNEDLAVLLPMINTFPHSLKVIIAPHEISEGNLHYIEKHTTKKVIRFSKADRSTVGEFDILLIDNIGMLSSIYRYGDFAYIGGAFGKGLHNILEAAVYGIPVFFGPSYTKFKEAIEMISTGAAFSVSSSDELKQKFTSLYDNVPLQNKLAVTAASFVKSKAGATPVILAHLNSVTV